MDELQELSAGWSRLTDALPLTHLAGLFPMVRANAQYRRRDKGWTCYVALDDDGDLRHGLFGYRDTIRPGWISIPIFRVKTEHFACVLFVAGTRPSDLSRLLHTILEDQSDQPIIEFPRVEEATARLLKSAAQAAGLGCTSCREGEGDYFNTQRDMDDLDSDLGVKLRQNLRRRRRRFSGRHALEFQITHTRDREENLARLERYMDLEAAGWKGRMGTDLRSGEADYYRRLVLELADIGAVRWFTLQADGRTAAMYLCPVHGGTMWASKTAYNEEFAEYSPGNELLYRILTWARAEDRITRLHMITHQPWHAHWHPQVEQYHRVRVFRSSILGRLLHMGDTMKRRLVQPEKEGALAADAG
jgi:hypothetical protein